MEDFFSFKKMISAILVKTIYILGFLIISFYGVFRLLPKDGKGNHDLGMLYGLGLLIIGNIIWRLICEGFIVLFSIHENLVEINNKLSSEVSYLENKNQSKKNIVSVENLTEKWKCPKCNTENLNTSFTCSNCGYSLV